MSRLAASLALLVLAACNSASPPGPAKPAGDRSAGALAKATNPESPPDEDIRRGSKAGPPRPRVLPEAIACPADTYPPAASLSAMYAANDVAGVRAAYMGTPLQEIIKTSDSATGRSDDATIVKALADPSEAAQAAATTAIQSAMSQWMRHNLKIAAEDPDPASRPPAWTAARCAWEHGLHVLGVDLQSRAGELSSEEARGDASIADDIDDLFKADPADPRQIKPTRQAIEKTWFRIVHRELAAAAASAREHESVATARRALGLFHMLRDRLQDRNTPAIATIEAQLSGKPSAIDAPAIMRQIDVALTKRARKYCSEAVDPKLHGNPDGAASVKEGETYTRLLLPAMRTALSAQKFDAAAYMTTWQAFAEAVDSADDVDEIKKHSDELVHWNCAFQQSLGIRECTSSADEAPR